MRPKHKKKKIPQINSMVDLVSASFTGSRSMRNGYENVGIGFDPNASVANNAAKLSSTGAIPTLAELRSKDIDAAEMQVPADPEMADWKEVMEIPEIKPKGRNVFLAPMERAYWRKLVLKYGDDYAAMARDIKLNNYQHTQRVCEKKAIIYRQLYRDDLSRITPAPRRKEIRKAENKAKREAEAAAAAATKEEEEEDQIASLSEEELSEVSMSEDIEESTEEESSSEEEVPPPRKIKKPVAAPFKSKLSKSPSRKHK
jgi:transcriptional antiterminator Rof (Rho-off)